MIDVLAAVKAPEIDYEGLAPLFAVIGLPPLVGVVAGPLLLMYRLNAEVKASEPYRRSLEAVRASSEVREALGSPIEPASVPKVLRATLFA